jgi:predicted patatin/cPLA2 family phospholipase
MNNKFALVLQGGGVRGAFTAGVLDVFLEQNIHAEYVIGVSAGALNGLNYVSNQPGRSKWVTTVLINDKKFKSANNVIKDKSLFDFDYLFDARDEQGNKFDSDYFIKSNTRYIAAATNCDTGLPIYFEKGQCNDIYSGIKASASMPLFSKPVLVDNVPCLDGGIAVVVPIKKAIEDGYKKIVVVLTRDKVFRKNEKKASNITLAKALYNKYPKFIESLKKQSKTYNNCIDFIDRLEQSKMIYVIRPKEPIDISHTDTDTKKLNDLYNRGRKVALSNMQDLEKYLDEQE